VRSSRLLLLLLRGQSRIQYAGDVGRRLLAAAKLGQRRTPLLRNVLAFFAHGLNGNAQSDTQRHSQSAFEQRHHNMFATPSRLRVHAPTL
jgi:hypothetical protein